MVETIIFMIKTIRPLIAVVTLLLFSTAAMADKRIERCSPKKSHPKSAELLFDLNWLNFDEAFDNTIYLKDKIEVEEKHQSTDVTYVGFNTYLVNCSNIDKVKLINKMSKSFSQGLSCLSKLGSHRKKDAGKLLNLFYEGSNEPLVIKCESGNKHQFMGFDSRFKTQETSIMGAASAFVCTNSLYPGAIFSKSTLSKIIDSTRTEETSTLFHELTHLLGYVHDGAYPFDVVRQIEACCFPESINLKLNPHLKLENACENLKNFKHNI